MSKAVIKDTVGGYDFTWPDGIAICVSRVRVHSSDGRVTGEIIIRNQTATLYPQTQLNFSADRTRNALVKTLTERYEEHDWLAMIDQLCYHVQERARQGEPVVELWTTEDVKAPEYLVYPIVMANHPNVLFGPPESGKTQFALLLTIIMMLPWTENTLGLHAPAQRVIPLWLDFEADKQSTLWNFQRIVHGADIGELGLPYRRCRSPLADDVQSIGEHVARLNANLVIIDSLGKATGGDLDKSESPTRFFTALDQLRCTSLIVAHTSKGEGKGAKKTIYGSMFFEAYARSVWEVRGAPNGDILNIGLWDNKANYRRKADPMAFKLAYGEKNISATCEDIKTVEDFLAHLAVTARITQALMTSSKSPQELKELLPDVSMENIYVELGRMVKKNKLVKLGSGKEVRYELPEGYSDST